MTGIIQNLFRKPSSDEPLVKESKLELIENQGIVGDKSFGRRKRQVLLVEEEIIQKHGLKPGDLKENIVTSNMRLSQLDIGTQLIIGDVTLEVTGDCAPCSYIEELQEGLFEKIKGNRGVLAIVRKGTELNVGDQIEVFFAED
jgi:MOSC domain-containing protein YiiM